MENFIKNSVKLGISGVVLFAIGWAFLTFYPTLNEEDDVSLSIKETTADILSMSFADRTRSQKFAAALENLGHKEPRVYDYNGQAIFFSTQVVRESPRELIEQYQREFVEQGINEQVHLLDANRIVQLQPENLDIIKGAAERQEIMPYVVNDNYVSMGGAEFDRSADENVEWNEADPTFVGKVEDVKLETARLKQAFEDCGKTDLIGKVAAETADTKLTKEIAAKTDKAASKSNECTKGSGDSCSQLRAEFQVAAEELALIKKVIQNDRYLNVSCPSLRAVTKNQSAKKLEKFEGQVKNFQSIEAFRLKGDQYTTVTATWSDDNFDLKKVRTKHYGFPAEKEKEATVPLCHDCTRTWIYKGTGKEDHLGTEMMDSTSSPAILADYYKSTLPKDGWKLTDGSAATLEIQKYYSSLERDARWVHFARGDEFLTLRIRSSKNGGSKVTILRTD